MLDRQRGERQTPAHHADKLAALANARKNAPPAEVVSLPALVKHLRGSTRDLVTRMVTWLRVDSGD